MTIQGSGTCVSLCRIIGCYVCDQEPTQRGLRRLYYSSHSYPAILGIGGAHAGLYTVLHIFSYTQPIICNMFVIGG